MSYIRCLSNPEGLYIWEDEDEICICQPGIDDLKTVPIRTWNKVFRQFDRSGFNRSLYLGDVVEYDGFRIQEITSEEGEHVFMSYNKWEIKMWSVTFEAIKTEVIRQDIIPKPLISAEYFRRLKNWFKRIWRKYV